MDAYEATRIVFSRIQRLDPENAPKIMGLLLIQDHGDKEMIRLAFGPEALLHSLLLKARKDLGLLPSSTPSTPTPLVSSSPFLSSTISSSTSTSSSSSRLGVLLPHSSASFPSISSSFFGSTDFIDEFHLSFLNHSSSSSSSSSSSFTLPNIKNNGGGDLLYHPESTPTTPSESGVVFPYGSWEENGHHRRSSSVTDMDLMGAGFGWKPCLYFARGYCKNGSSCRFLHGLPDSAADGKQQMDVVEHCQELMRSKSQRLGVASHLMPSYPFPNANRCMNYFLQQQQNDTQRAAAAFILGDESNKFGSRSMLRMMDRNEFGAVNPGSRQIYLTFPADSTFREEDVSNYFSIYGPVQDVRIPYQQKRMFGFVTFVYPETVKLILAKGNPHFVCDARVLVKPYKEKGKIPDKYNNSQEVLVRRKLEEQAELQQALQIQSRRLMGLQLLDVNRRSSFSATTTPLPSPSPNLFNHSDCSGSSSPEVAEENCFSSSGNEQKQFQFRQDADKKSPAANEEILRQDGDFHERSSSEEHNLPDSPFASPIQSSIQDPSSFFSSEAEPSSINVSISATAASTSSLFSPTSTLDVASFKSCFFEMPRLSTGQGALGM